MGALAILLKVLDLAAVGALTYERAVALKAQIDAMQAEGRDPTDAEWAALFDAIDADSAELDRLANQ